MLGRRILVASLSACLLACSMLLAVPADVPRPIGAGSFPVTPMHASAWFAHRADPTGQSVTLLVFFEGAPGWHDKPTDFKWEIRQIPATIDMAVGETPIHVSYSPGTGAVQILGHDFALPSNNVFLVLDIDGPAPRVKALGPHDLTFESEENPVLALLKRNPAILEALMGEPVAPGTVNRTSPPGPPDLVAVDSEGIRLLARNTPEQDRLACERFRKAAVEGYAPSQYRLGVCYGTGRGVTEDQAAANDWYLKAAMQGFVDAQYKLAHSYRVGRGTEINLASALEWYTRAAENGDVEAQHNLGLMYSTGQGSDLNPAKAFGWYLKAAENGDPSAQFEVARRYRDGDGVQRDLTTSYAWLTVLSHQRKLMDSENWKQVQELSASVAAGIDDEKKQLAGSMAQQLLRSYTRRYLMKLQR